jgi:hypothetical protein|tara:strand:- start:107 stop:472 length:366 start_codon:yes stop_codon:yes gene_type:complete
MRNPIGPFMVTTLLLITFLLLTNYAYGKSKSEWLSDNPCMIKVVITEKCLDSECLISETTKEEVLKCSDGYDGPSYWELFAQFYYTDLTTEPYCRHFARPDHPFKTPGTVCLSENGVWREE